MRDGTTVIKLPSPFPSSAPAWTTWEAAHPAGLVSLLSRKGLACLLGLLHSNQTGQAGDLSPPAAGKFDPDFHSALPHQRATQFTMNDPFPGNCTPQLLNPFLLLAHLTTSTPPQLSECWHQAQHSIGESDRDPNGRGASHPVPPSLQISLPQPLPISIQVPLIY